MRPEERLSEAIDRLLEGGVPYSLEGEEAELLALGRSLRAARDSFWPRDQAAFARRLMADFRASRRHPLASLASAAAAVLAAVALGQAAAKAPPVAAVMLAPALHTSAAQAAHAESTSQAPMSFSAATPAPAPTSSAAAAPKSLAVQSDAAVRPEVTQRPLRLASTAVGMGVVAVRLPLGGTGFGADVHATSLTRRTYHVAAISVRSREGHAVALLQTSRLPGGWYRLRLGGAQTALFLPTPGATTLQSGWKEVSAPVPGGPFAVRFGPTRTQAAFPDDGSALGVRLVGQSGAEDPAWAIAQPLFERPAIVLTFDPTPAGTSALTFERPGGGRILVPLP